VGLAAPVIQTRGLAAGEGVGYGLTGSAAAARRLATIGIGYADGWPRSLGPRGAGFFQGVRLPIVGRVSMDSVTLDVTALPGNRPRPGDSIQMIGPSQSVADVAADAGTVAHEILTGFGRRLERRYLDTP
jgi:alanine racemase